MHIHCLIFFCTIASSVCSFLFFVLFMFRALQHAIDGCGSKFEPFITTDLLQVIFTSLGHTNRFVRESGFRVISSIVKCPGLSETTTNTHWPVVAENLARGLADNWSQVCTAYFM